MSWILSCKQCGNSFEGYRPNQKFCNTPCGLLTYQKNRRGETTKKGLEINSETSYSIMWEYEMPVPISNQIFGFCLPFTSLISKNQAHGVTKNGRVYLRSEVKSIKDFIALTIRSSKISWFNDKIYISMLVQKPTARSDAQNVIDTIFDAIQEGTQVNDSWYAIKRLDWQIVKKDPKIYIKLLQDSISDKRICSSCGRILELIEFHGTSHNCKQCRSWKKSKINHE